MGAQGTTTIDFGAFPGKSDASVAVTGEASILAGSLVEAWLWPVDTADHTADEHLLVQMKVIAGNVIAGTGFTIYALNMDQVIEQPTESQVATHRPADVGRDRIGMGGAVAARNPAGYGEQTTYKGSLIYGLWTVAWVWN